MATIYQPPSTMIRRFRRLLRRLERLQSVQLERQDCCCGLTHAKCHPMLELEELGRATVGELAGRLQLDKSTMSRSVDNLVRQGLLQRVPHPDDRRYVLVSLTEEGTRRCREINDRNDDYFGRVLARVPGEQQRLLVEQFGILVEALEETPFEDEAAAQGGACGSACCSAER